MSEEQRQLKFGYSVWPFGRHVSSWRLPEASIDGEFNPEWYRRTLQTAERGMIDFFFIGSQLSSSVQPVEPGEPVDPSKSWIGESLIKPEAMSLTAFLAGASEHIGIVPTVNSTYANPYNVAREAATIDHLSHGRFGVNVVMGRSDADARNHGSEHHLSNEDRFDRGDEFAEVLLELWDSWDEGWLVGDKESAAFIDPTKTHRINHQGKFFSIEGPSNVPVSPQGRLPIVHAGTSERSFEWGARFADVRFIPFDGDQKAYYADQKARAAKYGRNPDEYLMLPGLTFYAAETSADAHDIFRRVQDKAFKPFDEKRLASTLSVELEGVDPKAKVIDVIDLDALREGGKRGTTDAEQKFFHGAGLTNATGLQVIERAFHGYGTEDITVEELDHFIQNGPLLQPPIVGDATFVADWLQENFEERKLDGAVIMAPFMPWGLDSFVNLVVPELQRRGLMRSTWETSTLRAHFGLPAWKKDSATV